MTKEQRLWNYGVRLCGCKEWLSGPYKRGICCCLCDPLGTAKKAQCLLEYVESRVGYWTSEKLMLQVEEAIAIVNIQKKRAGRLSGCSIRAAITRRWQLMRLINKNECKHGR